MKFSKRIIVFLMIFLGGGVLFFFGLTYFLSEVVGLSSYSSSNIYENIPDEVNPMTWVFGGVGILSILTWLIPFLIFGFIGSKFLRKKFTSFGKNNQPSGTVNVDNLQDTSTTVGNPTTAVNGATITNNMPGTINQLIQNALQQNLQQANASVVSAAHNIPGIVLPVAAAAGTQQPIPTTLPADILLLIQANNTLNIALQNSGGQIADAKVLAQTLLFENAFPNIDAVKIDYQMAAGNGTMITAQNVILTPKTSLSKFDKDSIIQVIYDTKQPNRIAICGTDKPNTLTTIL